MTPTTTLGGLPLPNPEKDGITLEEQIYGAGQRSGRGVLTNDVVGTYMRITLRWQLLTEAQRTQVRTAWLTTMAPDWLTGALLHLPNGDEWTVLPALGSLQEQLVFDVDDNARYSITAVFEEETTRAPSVR